MSNNQFNNPWTEEDSTRLRGLVENASRALGGRLKKGEVSKILAFFPNRTKHSVEQQISLWAKNGEWEKKNFHAWRDEEVAKLRTLYSGEKWRLDLKGEFPDREPRDVLEKARRLGLSRRILKTEAKQLTDMQCGILAGLIMGDGCLNHRIAGQGRKQHLNTIEFSNTDPGLVELFASMVTNCNVNSYIPKIGGFRKTKKPYYSATVAAREAVKNVLLQILPCLAGQKLVEGKEMLFCLEGGHQT